MSGIFFVVLGAYLAIIMGISVWSYFRTETEGAVAAMIDCTGSIRWRWASP